MPHPPVDSGRSLAVSRLERLVRLLLRNEKRRRSLAARSRPAAAACARASAPEPALPRCARGRRSSGPSTRSRRLGRCASRAPDPLERGLATEQLEALEQPGRDRRARDGDPDRLERLPRLEAELVGGARSACSIGSASNGSTSASAPARRRASRAPAVEAVDRLDRLEQEARRTRGTGRASRSSPARAARPGARAPRPSRSPARAGRRRAASANSSGGERPQVDAVHPVELLRSRTWPGSRRRDRARSARRARRGS